MIVDSINGVAIGDLIKRINSGSNKNRDLFMNFTMDAMKRNNLTVVVESSKGPLTLKMGLRN